MGKPVLTMKGNNFNSRCGESINLNVSLDEFIAEDEDDYINKAVNFSKSPEILENLNKNLREKEFHNKLQSKKKGILCMIIQVILKCI